MNGVIKPKFLEGITPPASYYATPNPYHSAPSNGINLLALSKYARSNGKKLVDLSREEDCNFDLISNKSD